MNHLSPLLKRCAVLGEPIAHSKSPFLHTQFAQQTGITLQYDKVLMSAENFHPWVKAFFTDGGIGLNVTSPHKERALAMADIINTRAKLACAANTLGVNAQGQIWADNTDGVGLLTDLQRLGVSLQDKRLLLVGAGGATMGILPALLSAKVASVCLLNRSPERAAHIVNQFQHPSLRLYSQDDCTPDILISSVSAGLAELLQAQRNLCAPAVAYDLNYGARATEFTELMRRWQVSSVFTGQGMLIEQAAESFYLWHGVRPDTTIVHARGLPD